MISNEIIMSLMSLKLVKNRIHEYPIVRLWYTKHEGRTIEELIEKDVTFFEWIVSNFQDVTPAQAQFYKRLTKKELPSEVIKDVTPYEWKNGDPECLYSEICRSGDLDSSILKLRPGSSQLSIF